MRVLAVVPSQYNTSPGQRFRLEQWAPRLAADGIEIAFAPFETAELHAVLYRDGHRAKKITAIASAFKRRSAVVRDARAADLLYPFPEPATLVPALLKHPPPPPARPT